MRGRRKLLLQLLERTQDVRSSQNIVVWTVVSVATATNAVLASALVSAWPHPRLALAIGVAGLLSATFWCLLVDRSLRFLEMQERVSWALETELDIPSHLRLTWSPCSTPSEMGGSVRAKPTLRTFCVSTMVGWFAVVVYTGSRVVSDGSTLVVVVVPLFLIVTTAVGAVTSALMADKDKGKDKRSL